MAIGQGWMNEVVARIAPKLTPEGHWRIPFVWAVLREAGFVEGVAYMPVPHCSTCKHWRPHPNDRLGGCGSPKMMKGYNFDLDEIPLDGVELESDEGWSMHTGRDFGCVQHEAKP